MAHLHFLISAVSNEFGSYRPELRHYLDYHNVTAKIQEDFPTDGVATLETLATFVGNCEAVVHLVGQQTGYTVNASSMAWLQQAYPKLADDLPELREVLDGTYITSYTQWEAYLARLMGKKLLVFEAVPALLPDKEPPLHEKSVQSQAQHLARLRQMGQHTANKPFRSVEHLVAELSHSGIIKLLVEAEVAERINEKRIKPNNLPYRPLGSLFKGRGSFIEKLRQHLTERKAYQALYGLGGIGKTRLAVEYAWQHEDEHSALLFLPADTPETLQASLASLCGPLVLNLAQQETREQEVRVAASINWLKQNPGWFLILDNLDTELAGEAAEQLLAKLSGGHVVLTTRLKKWSKQVDCLELDVLTLGDAVAFLLDRTSDRRHAITDDADAQALARDLGQLALALEQAGAYIEEKKITFQTYRERWTSNQKGVRKWFDQKVMRYPSSVAVTWQTSFVQLNTEAQTLLNHLAWLAAEPIPLALLDVPIPDATLDVEDALAELVRYSLATYTDNENSFYIHKLVQEVTRTKLFEECVQRQTFAETLNWLKDAFEGDPDDVHSWPTLVPLRSHILEVTIRFAQDFGNPPPTSFLLRRLGNLLKNKSQLSEAELLLRQALFIDETNLGHDHTDADSSLLSLARLLQITNQPVEAEMLLQRALTIAETNKKPNHTNVVIILNGLASIMKSTNRLTEAELLYHRAINIIESTSQSNGLAVTLNNLAQLLKITDRLPGAELLYRQALTILEANSDHDNPVKANALNNLAQLLKMTDRLPEAELLYRQALAILEANSDPNHPNIATCLGNIAHLLQMTNHLAEAEMLYRRALAIDETSLGPNHTEVARDLNNLAYCLQVTDRMVDAELFFRRAISILVSFHHDTGYTHPNIKSIVTNYIKLLSKLSKSEESIIYTLKSLGVGLK